MGDCLAWSEAAWLERDIRVGWVRYLSLFSGIEAATVAWHPLGWEPVAFAEIEPFASAVLKHHYPDVPNLGNVGGIDGEGLRADVVVFGSPCQSFSVAGKRLGLDDPRGNLALIALGVVARVLPRWVVFENVPGLLSSWSDEASYYPTEERRNLLRKDGLDPGDFEEVEQSQDFKTFLDLMGCCGYSCAYRVLDAQYVRVDGYRRAVPQRRRRVFVVGHLGSWTRAAAVLFVGEGLPGDTAPRREAGKGIAADVAPSIGASGRGTARDGESRGQDPVIAESIRSQHNPARDGMGVIAVARESGQGYWTDDGISGPLRNGQAGSASYNQTIVAYGGNRTSGPVDVATAVNAHGGPHGRLDFESETFCVRTAQTGANGIGVSEGAAHTLDGTGGEAVALVAGFDLAQITSKTNRNRVDHELPQPPLCKDGQPHVISGMTVRRLTPRECERLQGFPDDYTLIPYRNKPAADGPRYKALGNSMAVNVMRWIGTRIQMVEEAISPTGSSQAKGGESMFV
jgi:DNA (cytosine-5)-methyltransferase 1